MKDNDIVITTTELLRMIDNFAGRSQKHVICRLDSVPGGGVIFGVTGGVTEAVLRRLDPDHSKEKQ